MPNLLRFLLLIPVVPAMVDAWCILTRIGRNKTFCRENARSLRRISFYALTDTVLAVLYGLYGYFTADFDLELSGGYDWFIAFMVLVLAVSLAVTAAAAALSWLTYQAAELQDESDLTI